MKIPYLKTEYKPLFECKKNGNYVNDHCIIKYRDGKYHLFGITSPTAIPADERYFVHAVGESLDTPFCEVGRSIDKGTLAWSPCVTEKDGVYYMHYGPSPTSLAVSPDMYEWFGHRLNVDNEPLMAMHRDHFVLECDGKYYMYVSGVKDGRGAISVAISSDMITWNFAGYALTSSEKAPLTPAWGAMESPFVVKKDGLYYLFVTYTDCSDENYNNTLVFCSDNLLDFGCYMGSENEAVPIAALYAHAPEILVENGKYYITTCGWRNKPTPHIGCVSVAELGWK